jgi:hypothetical protein
MQKDLPGDVTSLQKFFNTIAIREDIVFDTAEWITEWKCVQILNCHFLIYQLIPTEQTFEWQRSSLQEGRSWLEVHFFPQSSLTAFLKHPMQMLLTVIPLLADREPALQCRTR